MDRLPPDRPTDRINKKRPLLPKQKESTAIKKKEAKLDSSSPEAISDIPFMRDDKSYTLVGTVELFLSAKSLTSYLESVGRNNRPPFNSLFILEKDIPWLHERLKVQHKLARTLPSSDEEPSSDSSISRTPSPPSSPSSPESLSQSSTDSEDLRTRAIALDESPKSTLNEAADMLLEQLIQTGQRYARGPYVSGGKFKETGEIYSQTYAITLINNELVDVHGESKREEYVDRKTEVSPQYIVQNAKLTDSNAHQFIEHLTLSDGSTKALPKRSWHAEENIVYSKEWNIQLDIAFNEIVDLIRTSQKQGLPEEALLQTLAQKQYEFTILINRSCCPRCAGILTERLNDFWDAFLNQQDISFSRGLMDYLKKNVFKFTISSMVLYRTTKESDIAKLKKAGWTIQVHQGLDNQEGEVKDWTDIPKPK